MILESGAVVVMDRNGKLDLANGYSGSSPGHTYSSASNEQRKEEGFGESQGYYKLCINGDGLSVGKKVKKELLFEIVENCKLMKTGYIIFMLKLIIKAMVDYLIMIVILDIIIVIFI